MYTLALLAALPGQFIDDPNFPKDKQQAALEATVRVFHPGNKLYGEGMGSGAIVGRDRNLFYVLTADHIIPPGDPGNGMELSFYTAKSYPKPSQIVRNGVIVLARNSEADVAILQAVLPDDHPGLMRICPPAAVKEVSIFPPAPPLPVMSVGIKIGGSAPVIQVDRAREVKVKLRPGQTKKVQFYEADTVPEEGRSGGPLVDQRGYLIGLCSGTERRKGYYVYIGEIHKALEAGGFRWLYDGKKPMTK